MIDNPYFQNVVSEFIALLLLILFGYGIHRLTTRRQLFAFFQIDESKRFITYLSRISVLPGGSVGIDGQPRSFAEPAVALTEVSLIGPIQRLFNYITPGIDSLPGILKSILISDVTTEFPVSPQAPVDIDSQPPFLTLGSPAYNAASQRVQEAYNPLARFEPDNFRITVSGLGTVQDPAIGFLVRARNQSSGQIAYYAAGPASVGTSGAASYLIRNWKALRKKYGDDNPFVVLLRFGSNDSNKFEIVAEKGT
jgi:hypothetical protein